MQADLLRLSWDDVITVRGTRGIIIKENDNYGVWSTVANDVAIPAIYDKFVIQVPVIMLSNREIGTDKTTAIYNRYTDEVMNIPDKVYSTRVRSGLKFISFSKRRLLIFRMSNGKLLFDNVVTELQYPALESHGVAAFIKVNGIESVVLVSGNVVTAKEYIEREYKSAKRIDELKQIKIDYASIYGGVYVAMTKDSTMYILNNYGMIVSAIRKTSPTYKYIKSVLGCG